MSKAAPAGGNGEGAKLKAAHAKIDKLTKLVEDLTAEVEELTADLIAAKLGQAELANAGLALTHEKRQLEKQVISGSAPMHLFSFSAHTHAYTRSDLSSGFVPLCVHSLWSSPSRCTR